jgi:hypothetical protein
MEAYILVFCPHCDNAIQIFRNEINCAIFRHGVLKSSGVQVNPHLPKIECDKLISQDLIFGCGKPFRLIKDNENYKAEICDYI